VPFAEAIKQATGLTTMAVGLITEAKQAEDIVASGKADMVALARGMLVRPALGLARRGSNCTARSTRRRNTGARSPRRRRKCRQDHVRNEVGRARRKSALHTLPLRGGSASHRAKQDARRVG